MSRAHSKHTLCFHAVSHSPFPTFFSFSDRRKRIVSTTKIQNFLKNLFPLTPSATFSALLAEKSTTCFRQKRVHVICRSTFPLTCDFLQHKKQTNKQPNSNHFTLNVDYMKPDSGFIFRLLSPRYCKTGTAAKSLNSSIFLSVITLIQTEGDVPVHCSRAQHHHKRTSQVLWR